MLKGFKTSNFGVSTLQAAVSPTTTVLEIASTDTAKFPTLAAGEWFMLTLGNASSGAREIVKCTNVSSNQLTVVRGQENTPAQSWPVGTTVSATVTAGTLGEIAEQLERTPATVTTRNLVFPEPDNNKGVGWTGTALANLSFPLITGSAAAMPAGNTAARPASPATGATRINTDTNTIEWWTGSTWQSAALSSGAAMQNTVVWADDAGDLSGGSGFTWPALYFLSGANQFTILDKINAGMPFRTLPAPGGGGSPSAFSIVTSQGSASNATSLTKTGVTISAGVVVIVVATEAGSSGPNVLSIAHPALSGQALLFNNQSYNAGSRVGRVMAYQFTATNNNGDLVVNFDGTAWTSMLHVWHVPSTAIGNFLGFAAGTQVTSGTTINASRTDAAAAVDLCIGHGTFTTSGQTWSASRNSSTLQAPVWSSWTNLATTTGTGAISGQVQTFTISPGNFAGGGAFVMQWGAPNSAPANHTVTDGDLGRLLLCQAGTTNLTLPTLTLPNGTDTNGLTGIEHYIMVEMPPSSTLNVIRGSGAELWSGFGSGNVSSFAVATTATERKRLTIAARHPNLWRVIAGETS